MSTHIVTITEVAPDTEDFEWISTCPDDDGACTVWYTCKNCTHEPTEAEEDGSEYTSHGVHHQFIDDSWMTETRQCALSATDSGSQGLLDIAHEAGVGTHQVDVSYEGDGRWDVTLIVPPATDLASVIANVIFENRAEDYPDQAHAVLAAIALAGSINCAVFRVSDGTDAEPFDTFTHTTKEQSESRIKRMYPAMADKLEPRWRVAGPWERAK